MKEELLAIIFRNILRRLGLIVVVCLLITNPLEAISSNTSSFDSSHMQVIELIKLNVSSRNKEAWLKAEKLTWEPWLSKQSGFLGRQLFWDKQKEEAMLLINWETRSKWKAIPKEEIEQIQQLFVDFARRETGFEKGNPFPINYSGELLPQ